MRSTRYRYTGGLESSIPKATKWLLISSVAVFILNVVCEMTGLGGLFDPLKLTPSDVLHYGMIWQLFTYLFLHSTSNPLHILFNMLTLWWFGAEIERTWGPRRFLRYYFICGVGAAITVIIVAVIFGQTHVSTIGASGAIYGVLLAFGLLFPDVTVFFLIFPMKAKYLVMIVGALAFFFSVRGGNGGVSNVAHLGGLVIGFIYLRASYLQIDAVSLRRRYGKWKLERAKRKFEVYMKKQGSKREPWVH